MARSLKAPDDRIIAALVELQARSSPCLWAKGTRRRRLWPSEGPGSFFVVVVLADLACYSKFRGPASPKLFHPTVTLRDIAGAGEALPVRGWQVAPERTKDRRPVHCFSSEGLGRKNRRRFHHLETRQATEEPHQRGSGCSLGGGCSRSHQANAKSWRASV